MKHKWKKNRVATHLNPNNGNTQVSMKTHSHTNANSDDLTLMNPYLISSLILIIFYGKSYDSLAQNKLGEDKHYSTFTSHPFKTGEEEEFCFDSMILSCLMNLHLKQLCLIYARM
jgi:hypothetical protein